MINLSYVMIYSFSGLYLKTVLGVATSHVGILEGIVEAASFLMKFVSGVFSDYWKRRKPMMILGYTFSVGARFLLAISATYGAVFAARLMERLGNGIQATPRDAIVADVAPSKRIGASYGLKRSLGQFGSFMGAVVGFALMYYFNDDVFLVFHAACIPAFLAFIVLLVFVREPKKFDHSAVSAEVPLPAVKRKHPFSWNHMRLLGSTFWWIMFINAIFMMARINETFMALHGQANLGLTIRYAPVVMMIYNLGYCAASYPVGVLADRMNRYGFLAIGIIFLILSDSVLAWATTLPVFFFGTFLWGIQFGITQNIFLSLIAETVPENLRGTGLGLYYVISAVAVFVGDTTAGFIAEIYGEASAFWTSGMVAIVALLTLMLVLTFRKRAVAAAHP